MKKKIFYAVFFLSGALLLAHKDWEQFLRANKFFEEGSFSQACHEYEVLPNKGPVVWFNFGNALFQDGKKAEALAAWRNAEKNASPNLLKKIYQHIDYVTSQLNQPLDTSLYRIVSVVGGYGNIFFLQIFFIILWILLWLNIFGTLTFSRIFLYMILLGSFLCIAVLGVAWWKNRIVYGVVTQETMTVFAGPHKEFHEKEQWNYGTQFFIVEKKDGWYKVRRNYTSGWVEASALKYQN